MKGAYKFMEVAIVVAAISLALGIFSRMLVLPLTFGLEAQALLSFSGVCLLFALTFGVARIVLYLENQSNQKKEDPDRA